MDLEKKDSEKKDLDFSKKGEDFICINFECMWLKLGVLFGNLCVYVKECLEKEKFVVNGENKENKFKDKIFEIVKFIESVKLLCMCIIFFI